MDEKTFKAKLIIILNDSRVEHNIVRVHFIRHSWHYYSSVSSNKVLFNNNLDRQYYRSIIAKIKVARKYHEYVSLMGVNSISSLSGILNKIA